MWIVVQPGTGQTVLHIRLEGTGGSNCSHQSQEDE